MRCAAIKTWNTNMTNMQSKFKMEDDKEIRSKTSADGRDFGSKLTLSTYPLKRYGKHEKRQE